MGWNGGGLPIESSVLVGIHGISGLEGYLLCPGYLWVFVGMGI